MKISRAAKKYAPKEGGFAMRARIDKSKVGADEGKETIIPFIFGDGFKNEAIDITEDADGNEESSESDV
jgi:hypothetical protein